MNVWLVMGNVDFGLRGWEGGEGSSLLLFLFIFVLLFFEMNQASWLAGRQVN